MKTIFDRTLSNDDTGIRNWYRCCCRSIGYLWTYDKCGNVRAMGGRKSKIMFFYLLLICQISFSQYKNPPFTINKEKKGYCFVNKNNKVVSKYYDTIRPFREGRALVGLRVKSYKSKVCWNILNERCQEILKIDSSRFFSSDFSEGYTIVTLKEYYYLIDRNGKIIHFFDFVLEKSGDCVFMGGLARCEVEKSVGGQACYCGPYGAISEKIRENYADHNFQFLIPSKYDTISRYKPGQLRIVGKAGKYGFLDTLGKLKIPLMYSNVTAYYWNNWSLVEKDKLYTFLDVISGSSPAKDWFQNVFPSRLNFTWVKKSDKWGAIDVYGNTKIPFEYNSVIQFDTLGKATIQKGKYFGIVDSSAKIIVPFQYQKIYHFKEGIALVQKNDKFGYINDKGQEISPIKYISATNFDNGNAIVENTFYWEKMDKNGETSFNSLKWNILIIILGILGVLWFVLHKLNLANL